MLVSTYIPANAYTKLTKSLIYKYYYTFTVLLHLVNYVSEH